MSPASGDLVKGDEVIVPNVNGFHSINVPSEWGHKLVDKVRTYQTDKVSIQLMSPASGDTGINTNLMGNLFKLFPFN